MKITRITFCILLAAIIWIVGCAAPKPAPNPLAGWKHYRGDYLDKTITDDYKNYIQTLSPEEQHYIDDYSASFFEDGTGQHAVKIEIEYNHAIAEHVLIYDKDDKRIKVIVYSGGRYAS